LQNEGSHPSHVLFVSGVHRIFPFAEHRKNMVTLSAVSTPGTAATKNRP
jgi:hypothetical protein